MYVARDVGGWLYDWDGWSGFGLRSIVREVDLEGWEDVGRGLVGKGREVCGIGARVEVGGGGYVDGVGS